jgi:hypothetical protein
MAEKRRRSRIICIAEGVAEPQAGHASSLSRFRLLNQRGSLYPASAHRYLLGRASRHIKSLICFKVTLLPWSWLVEEGTSEGMVSGDVVAAAKTGRRNALRRRGSEHDCSRTFRNRFALISHRSAVYLVEIQVACSSTLLR